MNPTLPRLSLIACSLALIGSPAYANPFDPVIPLLPMLGDGQWQNGSHVFELDAPADGSFPTLLGMAGSGGNRGQLSLTVVSDTVDASVFGVYGPANGARFVNQGSLQITARSGGLAAAQGITLASGGGLTNHGTLRVHASGQQAYVYGAMLEGSTLDNSGLIEVVADGSPDVDPGGIPDGAPIASAIAARGTQDMRNSGQIVARAQGGSATTGGMAEVSEEAGRIDNSGRLDVHAAATATAGESMAIGMAKMPSDTSNPITTASTLTNRGQVNVSASGGRSARAAGMLAADPSNWSTPVLQDGRIANLGRLTVAAQAASGTADAWGLAASGHGNQISNDGSVAVRAQGGHIGGQQCGSASCEGNARASALAAMGHNNTLGNRGQIDVTAQGGSLDSRNKAYAYGIESNGDGNTLSNEGHIRVSAQGGKQTPSLHASASAYGLYAEGDGSRITNLGILEVSASGGSKLDGDFNYASGNAYGIELRGKDGNIEHHGFMQITAQAQPGRDANAYGIHIAGDGTHTLDASGRIEVSASGGGHNRAHEVFVSTGQLDVSRYHLGVGAPAADEQLRAFRVENGGTLNFAATRLILSPGAGFAGSQAFQLSDQLSVSAGSAVQGSIASVESAHRILHATLTGNDWRDQTIRLDASNHGVAGVHGDAQAARYAMDSTRALQRPLLQAIQGEGTVFALPLYRHSSGDGDGGWHADSSGMLFGFNRALGAGSWGLDFAIENDRFRPDNGFTDGSRDVTDRVSVGVHALRPLGEDTSVRAGARYAWGDIEIRRSDRELAASARADSQSHSMTLFAALEQRLHPDWTLEATLDQLWYRQDGYRLAWDNPAATWADSGIEAVSASSLDAGLRLRWQAAQSSWQPRAALGLRQHLHGNALNVSQHFAAFALTQQGEARRTRGTLELGFSQQQKGGSLGLSYQLEADRDSRQQGLWLNWQRHF